MMDYGVSIHLSSFMIKRRLDERTNAVLVVGGWFLLRRNTIGPLTGSQDKATEISHREKKHYQQE